MPLRSPEGHEGIRSSSASRPRGERFAWAGFTLVELLVVSVIVGLLAALMLPGLGRSRKLARSAVCRGNLKQLWETCHDADPHGGLAFPATASWLDFVDRRNARRLLRCPEDDGARAAEVMATGLWIAQWHGSLELNYPLPEMMAGASHLNDPVRFFQCYPHWLSSDTLAVVIADHDAGANAQAGDRGVDVVVHFTFLGDQVRVTGVGDNSWARGGMSTHAVFQWDARIMSLPGNDGSDFDPRQLTVDCRNGKYATSYAMNVLVPELPSKGPQLLMVDYEKHIADPLADTADHDRKWLAPRHLGKANAVSIDGAVRALWPDELDHTQLLWRP